jgi:site-specific DNA-methyltransferase (adenine-specific)
MNVNIEIKKGDCLNVIKQLDSESIDLIYLDPPFFTQKIQKLKTRDRLKEFRFDDIWRNHDEYARFIYDRLAQARRTLTETGSIFVHCDKSAAHIIRLILDDVFGENHFCSEIIWHYKRWSNSKKGLMSAHQNIFFYSKSDRFKFNPLYQDYSETTNVDQILQKRTRDQHGKAVYAKAKDGSLISSGAKKGVPLSDVWEIPYLNPKAKERTGYPTQKPLLLLERIITLTTDPGDLILDPFCGSGTTLVAAKLLGRHAIGIDISEEAILLSQERINNPIKTDTARLNKGRDAYLNADKEALAILTGLDYIPVQRNEGIDALLKQEFLGKPVPIRVQRRNENLMDAANKLFLAAQKKNAVKAVLVKRDANTLLKVDEQCELPESIIVVNSTAYAIENHLNDLV